MQMMKKAVRVAMALAGVASRAGQRRRAERQCRSWG